MVASLGPVGIAPYHLPWPGSLTLAPATLAAIVVNICGGLRPAGAERIVVVNWHEGNSPTLRLAASSAQRQHGVQIMIAEAHVITSSHYPGEMEFTHAGAMETAAVLAYDEELVRLDEATEPSDYAAGEAAHGLYRRPDVYPVLSDFRDIAPTGWYCQPARAGRARAEEIAEAVADYVVRQAREIWAALASPAAGDPITGDGTVAAAGSGRRVSTADVPALMRAAVLRNFGRLELDEVPVPVAGPGEVLCRVRACGIAYRPEDRPGRVQGHLAAELSLIIGHEWSGEVAALGPGTERSALAAGTALWRRTIPAAASARCAAAAATTCASGSGSRVSGCTATPRRERSPNTLYGLRLPCIRCRRRSATPPRHWSTRVR